MSYFPYPLWSNIMLKDFLSYFFTRTITGAGVVGLTVALLTLLILKLRLLLIQAWPWIAQYFIAILLATAAVALAVWEIRKTYLHARKLRDERIACAESRENPQDNSNPIRVYR